MRATRHIPWHPHFSSNHQGDLLVLQVSNYCVDIDHQLVCLGLFHLPFDCHESCESEGLFYGDFHYRIWHFSVNTNIARIFSELSSPHDLQPSTLVRYFSRCLGWYWKTPPMQQKSSLPSYAETMLPSVCIKDKVVPPCPVNAFLWSRSVDFCWTQSSDFSRVSYDRRMKTRNLTSTLVWFQRFTLKFRARKNSHTNFFLDGH